MELAEYKFGLIAPAVNGTYPDPSMAEYFRRVCAEPVGLPDGTVARLKPSTLASWRRRYLKLGFEGLMPKGRSDLGTSRRIDADLGADIQAMRAESPRISAKMVHERLVEEGHVAAGELSVATVQRAPSSRRASTASGRPTRSTARTWGPRPGAPTCRQS